MYCKKHGEVKAYNKVVKYTKKDGSVTVSHCLVCSKCTAERYKRYCEKNRDHVNELARNRYADNPKTSIKASMKWTANNKDRARKYSKRYCDKNKERNKLKYQENKEKFKQYYLDNKEHILTRAKKYRESNLDKIKSYNKQYYQRNKEKLTP